MRSPWLWAILAIATVLRAALFSAAIQDRRRAFTSDSQHYWSLAGNLVGQRRIYLVPAVGYGRVRVVESEASSLVLPGPAGFGEQETFRTPGYPAFLAIGRVLPEGKMPLQGGWRLVLAIQVLIDVHLVLLTYLLGRELVSHGVGLGAAALQAVSPLAIAASCRIWSDGLFAFLLTAAVLLIVRHFRTGSWRTLLGSAALLAAACYVRPIGLAMAAGFCVVLLFGRKRLRRAGVLAGVVAALIAPWVVRNAVMADYVGFSSVATDGLYYFSAAEVVARKGGISAEQARKLLSEEEWQAYQDVLWRRHGESLQTVQDVSTSPAEAVRPGGEPGGAGVRYRRKRAMEILTAYPWTYAGIHLNGCLAFWLPGATDVLEAAGATTGGKGTLAVLHRRGPWAAARHYFAGDTAAMVLAGGMTLLLLVRYAGLLICLLRRCRLRMPPAAWLFVLLVGVSFLLPGPAAHPRFRVAVAPLLSVAATIGWIYALRRRRAGGQ